MKTNVKLITVSAVTFALTAVLGLLPFVFLLPLLFTCVTRDWKMSAIEGLFFGVLSYAYSFINPTGAGVGAIFITNPWIPIVPRVLVALGCHAVYAALRKVCKGKAAIIVPVTVACAVGSVLNTALVVPCLLWRAKELFIPILAQTMISAVVELVISVTVAPTLAITVGKALRLEGYIKHVPKADTASEPEQISQEPEKDSTCDKGDM